MPSQNDGSSSGGGVIIVGIDGVNVEFGPNDPGYEELKAMHQERLAASPPPEVPPSGTSTE